jgi:hypothetical protein
MILRTIRGIPKRRAHGVSMSAVSMATAIVITLPMVLFRLKKKIAHIAKS